jgi:adenylate cyclase
MSAVFEDGLSLFGVRRMMEGVIPPVLCTASAERVPNVSYLSLCEYVDPLHIALSYQFFNRSRENVLATRRASLTLDDPYTGAGMGKKIGNLIEAYPPS